MSSIITFYSFKGGVGRTFALANIAVLLAKKNKVLVIDWDLEAPGLDYYFQPTPEISKQMVGVISTSKPLKPGGLIGLLTEAETDAQADWRHYYKTVTVCDHNSLGLEAYEFSFISTGTQSSNYSEKLHKFSWTKFFSDCSGGEILNRWSDEWKATDSDGYDFIFIDSRTGLTDTAGICTVLMPDILALVFQANNQSIENAARFASNIQSSRAKLDLYRPPVKILPLLSKFHRSEEFQEAQNWLRRVTDEMAFIYDWRKDYPVRQLVEATYIPYFPYYSFGEPLPVLTDSLTDPGLPGYKLNIAALLLASDLEEIEHIILHFSTTNVAKPEDAATKIRALLEEPFLELSELQRLLPLAKQQLQEGSAYAALLYDAGVALREQSHFAEAEDHLGLARELHERQLGPNDPAVARDVEQLAMSMESAGRLDEAELLLRQALAIHEHHFGSAHPDLSALLNRLAKVLVARERPTEAEAIMRRILRIDEQHYGRGDPLVSRDINNLALLLVEVAADLDEKGLRGEPLLLFKAAELRLEARRLLERAMNIDKHHFTSRHPAVAADCNNLAQAMRSIGRIKEAERWMRLALEIDEKQPERDDAAISRRCNNLGSLLFEAGRYQESETQMRRALVLDENTFGLNHPQVAYRLNNLAALQQQIGQTDSAEASLRRALNILFRFSYNNTQPEPQLRSVLANYIDVLRRKACSADEIVHRLTELSQNAGFDEEGFRNLRMQMLGTARGSQGRNSEA